MTSPVADCGIVALIVQVIKLFAGKVTISVGTTDMS
jgi:hypothetical protein